MLRQKGFAHLLLILVIIILVVAVAFLITKNKLKLPSLSQIQHQEPAVTVKTSYQNPFKKESQYVNPFDQYKSPFLTFGQK